MEHVKPEVNARSSLKALCSNLTSEKLNFCSIQVVVQSRECHDPTGAAEEDDSTGRAGGFG